MKQKIEIEYTEKEFKSIIGMINNMFNKGMGFAGKAMKSAEKRRKQTKKEIKQSEILSAVKQLTGMIQEVNEQMEDLKAESDKTAHSGKIMESQLDELIQTVDDLQQEMKAEDPASHFSSTFETDVIEPNV